MSQSMLGPSDRSTAQPGTLLLAIAVSLAAFCILCVLVATSPRHALYDEEWYLSAVGLLKTYGLSVAFVREQPGPAGPTFALLHAFFEPLTGLMFPAVRWVNVALLALSAACIALTVSAAHPAISRLAAIAWGFSFLAMPFVGVSSGLALTEMPAVACFALALYLVVGGTAPRGLAPLVAGLIAGALLAFAVMARQNYVLLVLGLPLLMIAPDYRMRGAIAFATCLILILPVFVVWQGLVPYQTASVGRGFSILHAVLSCAYLGIALLIVDVHAVRTRLTLSHGLAVTAVAAGFLAAIVASGQFTPYLPFASLAQRALPQSVVSAASYLAPAVLVLLGAAFAYIASLSALHALAQMQWLPAYLWGGALVLCVSSGKVTHQFSSRYVLAAVPLILLAVARNPADDRGFIVRLSVGAALSLVALKGYLTLTGRAAAS